MNRAVGACTEDGSTRKIEDDNQTNEALPTIDSILAQLNRFGVAIRQSSSDRIDAKVQRFAERLDLEPFSALSEAVVKQLYPNTHQSLKQHLKKTMMDRYKIMLFMKSREGKLKTRRSERSDYGFMPTINEGHQAGPSKNPLGISAKIHAQGIYSSTPSPVPLRGISYAASQSDLSTLDSKKIRSAMRVTNNFQAPTERRRGTSSVQVGQGNYPRPPFHDNRNLFPCKWCSRILDKSTMTESDWRYSFSYHHFRIACDR